MDKDNGVGKGCGMAEWAAGRRAKRRNWDNCNRINKNFLKNASSNEGQGELFIRC